MQSYFISSSLSIAYGNDMWILIAIGGLTIVVLGVWGATRVLGKEERFIPMSTDPGLYTE